MWSSPVPILVMAFAAASCVSAPKENGAPQVGAERYELLLTVDGPVAVLHNYPGTDAREKLEAFISRRCDGAYEIEPRISACERNCSAMPLLAIAFDCKGG